MLLIDLQCSVVFSLKEQIGTALDSSLTRYLLFEIFFARRPIVDFEETQTPDKAIYRRVMTLAVGFILCVVFENRSYL